MRRDRGKRAFCEALESRVLLSTTFLGTIPLPDPTTTPQQPITGGPISPEPFIPPMFPIPGGTMGDTTFFPPVPGDGTTMTGPTLFPPTPTNPPTMPPPFPVTPPPTTTPPPNPPGGSSGGTGGGTGGSAGGAGQSVFGVRPFATGLHAAAELHLVSTSGPANDPVFQYDIKLTNTGTTTIGTFWFAWVPGEDFLPTAPLSENSPPNWSALLTGAGDSFNGTAIQWVADSPAGLIQPSQSLDGFQITTHDSLTQLAGKSPTHLSSPVLTSVVYSGAPLSDAGSTFQVKEVAAATQGSARLAFAQQPSKTVAGHTVNAVTVDLFNSAGKIDTNNNSNVTIALFNSNATLAGTLTVAAVNGVATFSDLSMEQAGSFTLQATSAGMTAGRSHPFVISADDASAHLVLTQQPVSPAEVGKKLAPPVVLHVVDQFGNLVTDNHSKVTLSIATGPAGGKIIGGTTVTVSKGGATFNNLRIPVAGDYTLRATDTALSNNTPVTFSETVNPANTTVPAPKGSAAFHSGRPITLTTVLKSDVPGIPFTGTVTVTDQTSNVLGTENVSKNGLVKITINTLAPGTYTLMLHYSGDDSHNAADSAAFTMQVSV